MLTVEHLLSEGHSVPVVIAAMVRVCRELNEHRDEAALCGLLRSMWRTFEDELAPFIKDGPLAKDFGFLVAGGFLDCYFGHRGDWREIERQIRGDLVGLRPEVEPVLDKVLTDMSEMIRRQAKRRHP